MSDSGGESEPEHGIDGAWYSLISNDESWPHLQCLCGKVFKADSWESVGALLDEHLADS